MTATLTPQPPRIQTTAPLSAGPPLDPRAFADVRRRLVLDHCKWDPQVGDTSTLAPFPLVVSRATWADLAAAAQRLAAETVAAEQTLLAAPRLQKLLAVPRPLRRLIEKGTWNGFPPTPVRVMRFDFHWTTQGWRVSEVNSDVPGGFCEASAFTQLLAAHYPALAPGGDPAHAWAAALAANVDPAAGPVALLAAAGFMEDQQVVHYLAARLRDRGLATRTADPAQLRWRAGHAHLDGTRLAAIVRFYQAEWLTRLPRRCGWTNLLAGGRTPVTNPAASILTESKRFPLTWDSLTRDVPTWRRLLPETRDPRDAPWQRDDDAWLIKSVYCNTGDTVTVRALAPPDRWAAAARAARRHPGHWVAQRRFETRPVETPDGPRYPCLGVYVIDGRAAGCYARLSPTPVVDYAATDVALLVERDAPA